MKLSTLIGTLLPAILLSIPAFGQNNSDSVVPVIIRTEWGDIQVDLYPKHAPVTCANFLKYVHMAGDKGGTFYRTVTMTNQPDKYIKIEVIQGGFNLQGIDSALTGPIPLERTSITGLSHTNGTLSMARNGPDTGTTEFFICIDDQPSLDYGGMRNPDGQGFAAFGEVTSGMDVVRKIQYLPANGQLLISPVRILSFSVIQQ